MVDGVNEGWEKHINKQLELSIRFRAYVCVKVLILYWEEGDEGFKREGRDLGRILEDKETFNFEVEEFAIPTSKSYLQLHNFITTSLLSVSDYADNKRGASLLIIHYGGHGDRNDDKHNGEEKRSVWAAQRQGGPTLEWFRVQEDLMMTDSHILLLFDCCFAAQAGRARNNRPSRIELLAAAAMGVQTPMPGKKSFTMALIRELVAGFEKERCVTISDLHRRLVAREAELLATPFYMKLGHDYNSIRLERFCNNPSPNFGDGVGSLSFQLLIKTRTQLDKSNLDEITQWLGENIPSTVDTVQVDSILQTTACIQNFVEEARQSTQPLTKGLNGPVVEDILDVWDQALIMIRHCLAEQIDVNRRDRDIPTVQKLAEKLLHQLDAENSIFVDVLEQKLLYSTSIVEEAMDNTTAKTLGIADQLKLRQIVTKLDPSTVESTQVSLGEDSASQVSVLQERKEYGPYLDPAEIPALTRRVSRLAELLSAPKNDGFLALQFLGWCHSPIEHQYVLDFKIPSKYEGNRGVYISLQSLIKNSRRPARPSLNESFDIAFLLAKALQKWHSIGWVHQSISSPNVIFFEYEGGKVDFASPFLGGFEFARPDSDPSMGHAADDLTFNVYRHPNRQGDARKGHRKIHDIYSLGVVLLELGLWQSSFDIVTSRMKSSIPALVIKQKLQVAAAERLPHYAGRSYKAAVEACLSSSLHTGWDDENESQLAVSFVKMVVDKLAKGLAIA
ncbi:hypothetical protein G7Y89_g8388 [Cudoniella acicularis]|uniref:Protein kinase domain-containing protein n=1 Tax=Cudoniella acicularis TaxID=354080 RepID=A0A8H4W145_9HELO|nr:hypothetical protein G7Y89_g8388 [Cudoniella acicularis]